MPVPVQTPFIEYTADGNTTHFPLTFDCFNQDHLIVKVDGIEPNVGTWSLLDDTVVFISAVSQNKILTIERNTPLERSRNYKTTDNSFRPTPINHDFDDIWRKLQELNFTAKSWLKYLLDETKQRIESDQNLQINIDQIKNNLAQEIINRTNSDAVTFNKSKEFAIWYVDTVLEKLVKGTNLNGVTDALVVMTSGRTQRDKNAESVSLADFGAVGDGETDDTEKVWNAFNSGHKTFNGNRIHKVSDIELVRALKNTRGTDKLLFDGVIYPCGDIDNSSLFMKVPSVFFNIAHAFEWLSNKRILGEQGEAFIHVADGVHNYSWTTNINHIDGQKIKIIGNESDCSKCKIILDNSNNHDGFFISDGHSINFINGFWIEGNYGWISKGEWRDQCYGAGGRAINGGVLRFGTSMQVHKMYYGLRAMYGSKIEANYFPTAGSYGGGFIVTNAGDVGIHAYASHVEANGATVIDTAHNEEGLGFGFCAEAGGFIICEYSLAMNNFKAGHYALSNGTAWAHAVEAVGNMYGVLAWGGTVECNSLGGRKTVLHNNTASGIHANYKGFVGANGCKSYQNSYGVTVDSHAIVDFNGAESTDNTNDGIRLINNGVLIGGGMTIANNHKWGITADTTADVTIENINFFGNGFGDISARNGAVVYALGAPDSLRTEPRLNVVSSRGSAVFNNTNDYARTENNRADVNGYQWMGNTLLQWGVVPDSGNSERDYHVQFPTPFPNECFNVTAIRLMSKHSMYGDGGICLIDKDQNGAHFSIQNFTESTDDLVGFSYQAIGY